MKKKYILMLVLVLFLVSGCVPNNEHLVGPDTGGIWQTIVKFSSQTVIFFSEMFNDNLVFGVIALAILFNVVLLPFTIQQQSFSKKIAEIQPKLDKIQKKYEKYGDDATAKMNMQTEMLALYQKYKINPMMGCLPMLVQMPLLIAVYGGVTNLIMYTQTMPDGSVVNGLNLFGVEHLTATIGSMDLIQRVGDNPMLLIFPVVSAILSFVSVKISNIGVDMSGANAQSMKMMMYISPIFSLWIGITLPAVISIYWIFSTLFRTIVTLYYKRGKIKEIMDKKKLK